MRDASPLAQYRAPDVDSGASTPSTARSCCCAAAALDEVGLFDERYWMYMEDLDLCFRLGEAGWVDLVRAEVTATARESTERPADGRDVRADRTPSTAAWLRFYRNHYAPHRAVFV